MLPGCICFTNFYMRNYWQGKRPIVLMLWSKARGKKPVYLYTFKIPVHLVFICHLSAEDVQWVITVLLFFYRPLSLGFFCNYAGAALLGVAR